VSSPESDDHSSEIHVPTFTLGTARATSVDVSSDLPRSELPRLLFNRNYTDGLTSGNRNLEFSQSTSGYQSPRASQSPSFSSNSGISPGTSASYDVGAGSLLNFSASSDNARHFTSQSSNYIQQEQSRSILPPLLTGQHPTWPRFDIQEACLMRYFVENLAKWVRFSSCSQLFQFI